MGANETKGDHGTKSGQKWLNEVPEAMRANGVKRFFGDKAAKGARRWGQRDSEGARGPMRPR